MEFCQSEKVGTLIWLSWMKVNLPRSFIHFNNHCFIQNFNLSIRASKLKINLSGTSGRVLRNWLNRCVCGVINRLCCPPSHRLQTGMRGAFGKPQGTVARVRIGQPLISVHARDQNKPEVIESLRRAKFKFPGRQKVREKVSGKFEIS